jgi:hypothetical protein
MDQHSRVEFLERGNFFCFDNHEYQVLWPSFSNLKVHGKVCKSVNTLLKKVVGDEFSIGITRDELSGGEKIVDLSLIDSFIEKILVGYKTLTQETKTINEENRQALLDDYRKISEATTEISKRLSEENLVKIKNRVKAMNNQENRLSIVFNSSTKNNEDERILMTGDITKPVMNKIILNNKLQPSIKVHQKYKIIKAQHHGTTTHFYHNLPIVERILISNGVASNRRFGQISYLWGSLYGSHRKGSISCTNAHRCEQKKMKPIQIYCSGCPNSSPDKTDFTIY